MPTAIMQATSRDYADIHSLLHEYLDWANRMNTQWMGITFDVDALLVKNMREWDAFMPPAGCLFLARVDGAVAGCVFMHRLAQYAGEVKRMYVRPAFRRQGIGGALVDAIIRESRTLGIHLLRLNSQRFMTDAHALYRSRGFRETEPYEGSEIPQHIQPHWIFMEQAL
jgi:GNAT superfamily N-acetyltransferase